MEGRRGQVRLQLRVTENVSEQDIQEIHRELRKFNRLNRETSESIPVGAFYEEPGGQKRAGLTGELFGNWLCIQYLWVSQELRGQGLGSGLLAAAEREAVLHGAKYAFVDTFDFQAPGFYVKHGYKEVFRLFDYPYTGARYYYIKRLRPPAAPGVPPDQPAPVCEGTGG